MSEREQLFEAFDTIEVDDDKQYAYFEGEEVVVLKVYLRNRHKVALIQTQTLEQIETYYELLEVI